MLGMASVVTRSVPDFHLVLGHPARSIGCVCRCGEPFVRFEPPGPPPQRRVGRARRARFDPASIQRPIAPDTPKIDSDVVNVPLVRLAFARSGDKGDNANIGILPRDPSYAPFIWSKLTEEEVARRFAHYLKGKVERFFMPGTGASNFLLHNVLGGGGVASLRNDPQAKGYSQILLQTPISVPRAMAENL